MAIERFEITDRAQWLALRRQDVTASAAAALLGIHPYASAYGLWAEKTGKIQVDDEVTAAMDRGLELEPIAVSRLRKERPGWRLQTPREYLRDTDARLGATPDQYAYDPDRGSQGIIQIKSVEPGVFRSKWRIDGEVEPPLWIAVQAVIEAHLTGAAWCAVAALVIGHGIDLHVIDIPIHAGLIDRVKAEVAAFWRLVEAGRAPDPDYGRDASLISRLYAKDDGTEIDLTSDNEVPGLLAEWKHLGGEATAAEKRRAEIKAALLVKLGTATSARLADGTLTLKTINRKGYTVEPSSYRSVSYRPNKETYAS